MWLRPGALVRASMSSLGVRAVAGSTRRYLLTYLLTHYVLATYLPAGSTIRASRVCSVA